MTKFNNKKVQQGKCMILAEHFINTVKSTIGSVNSMYSYKKLDGVALLIAEPEAPPIG